MGIKDTRLTFVKAMAFSRSAGVLTPLYALLHPDLRDGSWLQSWRGLPAWLMHYMFAAFQATRIRVAATHGFLMFMLFAQRTSYGCHITLPSTESRDPELQKRLYEWSR